jgi:ribose transport system permease protein
MSTPTAPPPDEEALDAPVERQQPAWRQLLTGSSTSIFLVLIGMIVVFSVLQFEQFLTVANGRNIATDAAVLLVVATGLTYVVITAGIDLSVGSVLVFSSVVAARAMNAVGGGDSWGVIIVGLLVGLAAGLGWGILNGFLVAKAKIPSFIVTLGTLGMALGAALLITGGVDERDVPFKLVETIGTGRLFDQIPYLVLIAAVIALIFGIILAQTRFGRYTYAIGSNEEGVRRAGVNVDLHLIKVYALCGGLAGFAGVLSLARFGTTSIAGNTTLNLDAIAAIVIGGTSLFGGVGVMVGTVVGVFIPAVLRNGFVIVGVQPFWQQVAVGAVLIIAVYIDQIRRARYAR